MTPPPHYRRNLAAFMGDFVGFSIGLTFASQTTVLPELVGRLTDSEVAVGLLSTVSNGAWLLPQLVYANFITNKQHKKPFVTLGAIVGRPFYLVYAAALALGIHQHPELALLLLYAVQAIFYSTDALAAVAWFDVMGKAIPSTRRGRLIGGSQLIGSILSVGAGAVIAALLGANGPAFPRNYAVILSLAGVALFASLLSWLFVVEPEEPVEETRPVWRDYLPSLLDTLRQDRAFAQLILVRLLAGCDGLALGFYILFATRKLGLPPETIGLFTAAQTIGRILASVGLGALAERAGSHRVIQVATGIGMTAPLLGLTLFMVDSPANASTAVIFAWVFVTIGLTISSGLLGFINYTMDIAPVGQRPTYIGLLNTLTGVLVVLPTFGGWLLRNTSYGVLFGLTASLLVIAHLLSLTLPSAHTKPAAMRTEPAA
jgi:MFS family permease